MSAREPKRARPAGLEAVVTSLKLAGLGTILSAAVGTDGTRFVCTALALYAFSPNGMKSLIAGHKTERRALLMGRVPMLVSTRHVVSQWTARATC